MARTVFLALTCLAYSGHTRRVRNVIERVHIKLHKRRWLSQKAGSKIDSSSAKDALRVHPQFVLASSPAAAFDHSGHEVLIALRSAVGRDRPRRRLPSARMKVDVYDHAPEPLKTEAYIVGNRGDFLTFWKNDKPHCDGAWTKFWSHPQMNTQPYWYHQETDKIMWQIPAGAASDNMAPEEEEGSEVFFVLDDTPRDRQVRVEANGKTSRNCAGLESSLQQMTRKDLQNLLGTDGEVSRRGFAWKDVACRALHEYEQSQFLPHVLSDLRHQTAWSFPWKGKGRAAYAEDAFFDALAAVAVERMHFLHPISVIYLLWAFVRARVVKQELMDAAEAYLCAGRMPMLDRCGLAMCLRLFGEQSPSLPVPHSRLFKCATAEVRRPARLRTLASRDIQDMVFGYSKRKWYDNGVLEDLAARTLEILDGHDPKYSQTRPSVVQPYLCKNGKVETGDHFRINSAPNVRWLLECYLDLRAPAPIIERLVPAMVQFVLSSIQRAPHRFEPKDLIQFIQVLSRAAQKRCRAAAEGLTTLAEPAQSFCQKCDERDQDRLRQAYERAKVTWLDEDVKLDKVCVDAAHGEVEFGGDIARPNAHNAGSGSRGRGRGRGQLLAGRVAFADV